MPPSVADVFNTDIFSMFTLCAAIERLPYVPGRVTQMGLFADQGIPTTTVMIEERAGLLNLVPTTRRGAPAEQARGPKRVARSLLCTHIPYEDTIQADDVLNRRQFGSENLEDGVAMTVNDRLAMMKQDVMTTLEYLKLGALKGVILDADGATVIYNLFTEFAITQTTVDFELAVAGTDIRLKCLEVKRAIEDALGAGTYGHIHALCGQEWFDDLVSHADVKAAYDRWRDGEILRSDVRAGFNFAGVIFEEYRGTVSGVDFIEDDEAHFFPVGVPNLFATYFAPGDFIESVGTNGIPLYAKRAILEFDRGVKLHVQSNPLPLCHRPGVLVKATTSSAASS